MELDRRQRLLGVALAALLVVLLAFATGFAVSESRTAVESSVVTTQAGNVTGLADSVVLVVRGDGGFADRVRDRLADRLAADGYAVAVARELGGHAGPVLVVDLDRVAVDPGIVRHGAAVTAESYYATDWNVTAFERFRETGRVRQRAAGEAVVTGEYVLTDRTRGISTRYRARVVDAVVDAVAEHFAGSLRE